MPGSASGARDDHVETLDPPLGAAREVEEQPASASQQRSSSAASVRAARAPLGLPVIRGARAATARGDVDQHVLDVLVGAAGECARAPAARGGSAGRATQ